MDGIRRIVRTQNGRAPLTLLQSLVRSGEVLQVSSSSCSAERESNARRCRTGEVSQRVGQYCRMSRLHHHARAASDPAPASPRRSPSVPARPAKVLFSLPPPPAPFHSHLSRVCPHLAASSLGGPQHAARLRLMSECGRTPRIPISTRARSDRNRSAQGAPSIYNCEIVEQISEHGSALMLLL